MRAELVERYVMSRHRSYVPINSSALAAAPRSSAKQFDHRTKLLAVVDEEQFPSGHRSVAGPTR
jgi:hypothetical protein